MVLIVSVTILPLKLARSVPWCDLTYTTIRYLNTAHDERQLWCSLAIQLVFKNEHQLRSYLGNGSMMIQTAGLTKMYTASEVATTALRQVNFAVQTGEFVAVMGPSGGGKSTLLHLLGLLDTPSEGTYVLLDQEVSRYSERQRTALRKQHIGFVFQSFNLIDDLTVFENVELPLIYQNVRPTTRRRRVREALEQMQIASRSHHFPQQLSGGQQQRVAVARAMIARPTLLLADEPTENLDSTHGQEVMQLLSALNDAGVTIVMVTHSPDYAAYSHRVVHLFDGRIVSEHAVETTDRRWHGSA